MRSTFYCFAILAVCSLVLSGCPGGKFMGGSPSCTHTYTLKAGENCYGTVAKKVYGNWECWEMLEKANPDIPAGKLKPGVTVKVPPVKGCSISSACTPMK